MATSALDYEEHIKNTLSINMYDCLLIMMSRAQLSPEEANEFNRILYEYLLSICNSL